MTKVIRFADQQRLAGAVAGHFLEFVRDQSAKQERCGFAVAGGRIAGVFFSQIAAQAKREDLTWVHFFWGDERGVPPQDPESNFNLARQNLLEPLQVPGEHIHRIRGELPPMFAAHEAERDILNAGLEKFEGQPVLDLVQLGIGEDGHVASLFPDESAEVISSPAVYRAVTGPKPPYERITLGYAALAAAKEVWVLASGSGKDEILRSSLAGSADTPLARLLRMRQHTLLFTDLEVREGDY